MELNDLLAKAGIDPRDVLVFRHRPSEPRLYKVFRWLAHDRPDLFNAYQQTHGIKVENALQRAKYVASFIGHESGKAVFVGLYEVGDSRSLSFAEYWAVPAYAEMKALCLKGFTEDAGREFVLWFDLRLSEFRFSWQGKLIVDWPGPELSWFRWADRNHIWISAIREESLLVAPKPVWYEFVIDWQGLATLPYSWRNSLEEWRGVYFIFDRSDSKGYVGSAYGSNNLLGRWRGYAKSGHGGNVHLKNRDCNNFQFSILELTAPNCEPSDVIRIENNWKDRLCTRYPMGLNDN
jgi:hypothetical protein